MPDRCPVCDKELSLEDQPATHVWLYLPRWGHRWCNYDFAASVDQAHEHIARFERHCEDHGRFLAHYLECQLGT
jgi:hypothetical protein